MANQEHLAILRQGVEVWNRWRNENSDEEIDLSEADLRGAKLDGINLSEATLTNADLSESQLVMANLFATDLERSQLKGAELISVILCGANLKNADLTSANMIGANFGLSGLTLNGFVLTGNPTDLSGTIFKKAQLTHTNFSDAILDVADLSYASLFHVIFANTDLSKVKGLETVDHKGPSTIGIDTIYRSNGNIPEVFLKRAGVDDTFITYIRSLVGKAVDYYSCFISYSSKDEAFAKRLYADLQSNNVRCWFAPEDLKIGDKFRHRIDESIRMYDKLLLVLSEASLASSWVSYEVEKALDKEPEGKPNVLFPIRLDEDILTCETDWAKDIRKSRHIGDFQHWKDHDAFQIAFERLLRDLKAQS